MSISSFGKILTILDLFSMSRPVINVDLICVELELSKPTCYRYLKELVTTGLLQRICGTSGDYMLGPKIAMLDYISRATDPLVQMSLPFMKEITQLTELDCLLTFLNYDYCIDLHSESFQRNELLSYGRGNPRSVYMGSSPKMMVSHLNKKDLHLFYQKYAKNFLETDFASSEDIFMSRMKKIKKQGYCFSQGEVLKNYAGLAVPIDYSKKLAPLALTVIGSKNRFAFVDLDKLITILKDSARQIEQQYSESIYSADTALSYSTK